MSAAAALRLKLHKKNFMPGVMVVVVFGLFSGRNWKEVFGLQSANARNVAKKVFTGRKYSRILPHHGESSKENIERQFNNKNVICKRTEMPQRVFLFFLFPFVESTQAQPPV